MSFIAFTQSQPLTHDSLNGNFTHVANAIAGLATSVATGVTPMLPLPGALQTTDTVMVYRPGAPGIVYLVSATALGVFTFIFNQPTPAATWVVNHSLGRFPAVTIVTSSGDQSYGDINYVNSSQITLSFASAFAGVAYFN